MRGLTAAEAEALRDQLDAFDPERSPEAPEGSEPRVLLESLTARGLLREVDTDWLPDPDDPEREYIYVCWDVTRLGRIALACHAATSSPGVFA